MLRVWLLMWMAAACSAPTTPMQMQRPRGDLEFEQLDLSTTESDLSGTAFDLAAMDLVQPDLGARDLRGVDLTPAANDDLLAPRDMAMMAPADMATFSNCKTLHTANPGAPSGTYNINPGAGVLSVFCDMSTDGGGWTMVFIPSTPDFNTDQVNYTVTSSALWTASSEVLLAIRNDANMILGDWARFVIPGNWRTQAPFRYNGNDEDISVVISGAVPVTRTLRYGAQNFFADCTDPWIAPTTTRWGRICIQNTTAPFYDGFAALASDGCQNSLDSYGTAAKLCSGTRLFTIAIR